MLNFNNSTTWPLQMHGREQAKEMLKLGEGVAFDALDSWLENETAMKAKWGSFMAYVRSYLP